MTVVPADFVTIALLVVLEGLLSADNAMVLAVLVLGLPREQQQPALRYGMGGAFLFRTVAVLLASQMIRLAALKLVGGVYLLWLPYQHFFLRGDAAARRAPQPARRWLGMSRLLGDRGPRGIDRPVFAVDSILVGVAMSPKLWVVVTGGILGIVAMRLVIGRLLEVVRRYPPLVDGAFVIIAWVGIKLLLEFAHAAALGGPSRCRSWISLALIVVDLHRRVRCTPATSVPRRMPSPVPDVERAMKTLARESVATIRKMRRPSEIAALLLIVAVIALGVVATIWGVRYASPSTGWRRGSATSRSTARTVGPGFASTSGDATCRSIRSRRTCSRRSSPPRTVASTCTRASIRWAWHARCATTSAAVRQVEGASTLTQQLARTLFLSNARTVGRKGQEAVLALMIETRLSKRADPGALPESRLPERRCCMASRRCRLSLYGKHAAICRFGGGAHRGTGEGAVGAVAVDQP